MLMLQLMSLVSGWGSSNRACMCIRLITMSLIKEPNVNSSTKNKQLLH